MTFNLNLFNILMLTGPSNCGKSTLAELLKVKINEKYPKIRVKIISSDNIRRELLGQNLSKGDHMMGLVSKQAFSVLNNLLDVYTSYPLNNEIVIVDTTALNQISRDNYSDLAKKNGYNITAVSFDYKDRSMYFRESSDKLPDSIISKHIKQFKESLRDLKKGKFNDIIRITKPVEDIDVFFPEYENYQKTQLDNDSEYVVVSDIHGHYDEFMELLEHNKFKVIDGILYNIGSYPKKLIIAGDIIDKERSIDELKKLIDFIHMNNDNIIKVKGNHEHSVFRWLNTENKNAYDSQFKTWFTSVDFFSENDEYREKFFDIYKTMLPFVKTDTFIVTHAPAPEYALGKLDVKLKDKSNNKIIEFLQTNVRFPRLGDYSNKEEFTIALSEKFKYLKDDAEFNYPLHIFGHLGLDRYWKFKNKMCIDTDVANGGSLTSVKIEYSSNTTYFVKVKSKTPRVKESNVLFPNKDTTVKFSDIDGKLKNRIEHFIKNKGNYVTGTISPSDKGDTLESLEEAIKYYSTRNISEGIIQIKDMGSRGVLNLTRTDYTLFTRKGYIAKIDKQYDVDAEISRLRLLFEDDFNSGMECIILDTEIMPWMALGKGMIEDSFIALEKILRERNNFLNSSGFAGVHQNALNLYNASDFKDLSNNLKKTDLINRYGESTYRLFHNMPQECFDYDMEDKLYETFKAQIDNYGSDGKFELRPFMILKKIYQDGAEKVMGEDFDNYVYPQISSHPYLKVNFKNPDMEAIKKFWDYVVSNKFEGVMVKPKIANLTNVAPMLKVRNSDYLTIVYGYDYTKPKKYDKLMGNKRITKKLSVSIDEYAAALNILKIPYKDITLENNYLKDLLASYLTIEEKETILDPRL